MIVTIRDNILKMTGFDNLAEGLRYYGLAGIELAVGRDSITHALEPSAGTTLDLSRDDDVRRLGEQMEATGFCVSAFLLGNDFNATDRDAELDWIIRVVKVAGALGVPTVRVDAIMSGERDLPKEEREEIFASGVRAVLDATHEETVDLGIENHGFQGNDPAFLEGLLRLVRSQRLGVTMDTGNFYWAGHPISKVYDIMRHLAPAVKHTHVKNIRYPEGMRDVQRELGYEYDKYVCPIPEGDIDHAKVVGYLKRAGYDRDLCIEDESLGKYDEGHRRANIRAAAEYLRQLA